MDHTQQVEQQAVVAMKIDRYYRHLCLSDDLTYHRMPHTVGYLLLIYLKGSIPTLVDQIQKRGRDYEENIRLDYLKRLNDFYNKWIENYKEGPLLVIDIDKNKFPENEEHLGEIMQKIDSQLYGLF